MNVWKKTLCLSFISLCSATSALADYKDYDKSKNVFLENHLLPQEQMWEEMYDDAQAIEESLNSGDGTYYLEYKKKGGSSQQTLVRRSSDNKIMGIWSAPNHATYLEGEIFAFNIARLLGHSEWSTPGTRMFLVGKGRKAAYKAINPKSTPNARKCNRDHMNSYYKANSEFMPGAFFSFINGIKPEELPELVYRLRGIGFTPDHWAVGYVNGKSDLPSDNEVYYDLDTKDNFNRLKKNEPSGEYRVSTERKVAKQISFMSVVDALNSQRDRFGPYGSNMEVMISLEGNQTEFTVSLVDNGGIAQTHNTSSLKTFLGHFNSPKLQKNGKLGKAIPAMRRFEKDVYDRVQKIYTFLNSSNPKPLVIDGHKYETHQELKYALGLETIAGTSGKKPNSVCGGKGNYFYLYDLNSQYNIRWKNFVRAIKLVAPHMKKMAQKYPNDTFLD